MRIGLAQINTIVGDLAGNSRRILEAYRTLVAQDAELVIYPELVVSGYPPRDLLFKKRFVADVEKATRELATQIGTVPALIGYTEANMTGAGRSAFNSAAFCHQGKVTATARKCLLPTYDVFDEDRYFEPAAAPIVVEFGGLRLGITICEDIWTHAMISTRRLYNGVEPVRQLAGQRCDLMVNLSASPWNYGKGDVRHKLVADTARQLGCPVAYVNAVGGNDELLFDGRSVVCDAQGNVIGGLAAFREQLQVVEVGRVVPTSRSATAAHPEDSPYRHPTFEQEDLADIYDALVLGVRDYAQKTGFKKALLGLSGGIDSALTAVIAAEALGPKNVIGVSLPSVISSQHSKDDARILAANLGIEFHTISIADTVGAAEKTLAPIFAGRPRDIAEENIQARARGLLLMAISNKFGALLLTTGNKSELAVGYCTLYGDMCGGLAVISDVFKMQVYALSRWINRNKEIIPVSSIDKAPSAELRPDQTDQDSLPPYAMLDAILKGYVEEGLSRADLVAQGFDSAVVNDIVRKVDLNEYKRKQAAPGLKITPLAFGVGRRIPIVQKYVS
ncbi:NAD+ synthase [Opitutus sp. GAS368]|uniref:NAD+ synthase n=1 Tax=Opitutus sp. GAS368 TaxID=1882749 RepID=UPI00087B9446|nr:NAD+ synthase [Opitutus sp. GAS368]SDS58299.1 NAD+ synthase (glutamine-hydrolysing) [Opitutus sp. GAS368]